MMKGATVMSRYRMYMASDGWSESPAPHLQHAFVATATARASPHVREARRRAAGRPDRALRTLSSRRHQLSPRPSLCVGPAAGGGGYPQLRSRGGGIRVDEGGDDQARVDDQRGENLIEKRSTGTLRLPRLLVRRASV